MKKYILFIIGVLFIIKSSYAQYCSPNTGNASLECISNVTFVGINNTTSCTDGTPVNYTSHVANVNRGLTYALSVTIHADANEYVYAFIDWNNNGVLNDAGETYTVAANTSSNGPHSINISVPLTATLGNTRMRIINAYNTAVPNPCMNAAYGGEAEDYTVNVGVVLTCLPPTNLTTSNLNATTANLSWTEANPIPLNGYQWELRTSGAAGSGPTGLVQSGNTASLSKNFTALLGNTNYTFYIRSDCSNNDYSTWASTNFTTLELGQIGSGNASSNNSFPINTSYRFNYSQQIYLASELTAALGAGNTYITKLRFKQLSAGAPNNYNNWTVYLGNTTKQSFSNTTDWVPYNEITEVFSGDLTITANTWFEITLTTPFVWNGVDNLVVAVDENSPGNSSSSFAVFDVATNRGLLYFNNVTNPNPTTPPTATYGPNATIAQIQIVASVLPSCIAPNNIHVASLSATSAVINWNAASPLPAIGYQWELRTAGSPGSGPIGLKQSSATAGLSANPINLNANTQYTFYIRSACGSGNFSSWTVGLEFKTPCNAVNVPYLENFESVMPPNIPSCAAIQNAGTGNNWTTAFIPPNRFLRYAYHTTEAANAWFYTAPINLTAGISYRLSYKYSATSGAYPEKLKVMYGNQTVNTAMTTLLADHINFTNTSYITNIVDFTPNATGVYYIGFNAYSNADKYYINVDDISVELSPPCIVPSNIHASSINNNSATISYDTSNPAPNLGYQWELRTSGAAGSGPTGLSFNGITNDDSLNFTGLATLTTYKFYIRAICNVGDTSSWSNGVQFTTSINRPWIEEFISLSFPAGWVNGTSWQIGSVRGVKGNPGNAIYKNLWNANPSGEFKTAPIGPIAFGDRLSFDFKIAEFQPPYLAPSSWGNFKVLITTNDSTWVELETISSPAAIKWESKIYELSAYAGQTIRIKIEATRTIGDFDIAFDNFKIGPGCPVPSAQPTNLILNPSATSIAGSFTAANPVPTGYLVVRTDGNIPSSPVNGIVYTVGRPALGGVVVAAGNATSFNAVGLSPGQTYSFFIYSYNHSGCIGITYNTVNPLTDNALTRGLFTSITSGNWENPTTWNQNSVPSASDDVIIDNAHTVTVQNAAAAAATLTVNYGGTLFVAANVLDVLSINNNGIINANAGSINIIGSAATGVVNNTGANFNVNGANVKLGNNGGSNRTFNNDGILTVTNGTLTVNGNYLQVNGTINQSGGNIVVDGNAGGNIVNSVADGTRIFQIGDSATSVVSSKINLTGGTLTIVDPHAASATNYAIYINVNSNTAATNTHTLKLGDGISLDAGGNTNGYFIYPNVNAYYAFNNVIANAGNGTNRVVSFYAFPIRLGGNLTINNGEFLNNNGLYVNGNIVNNGTLSCTDILYFGKYTNGSIEASTNAQTISGSGIFRNNQTSPTANFTRVTFNNANASGITFNTGINNPSFSGIINVVTGTVYANSFNINGVISITLSASSSIINVNNFNHNAVGAVTLNGVGWLNVYNAYTFGNIDGGSFDAGGRMVLKSTATKTAYIADITNGGNNINNTISGNIIQERYIPAKASRKWILVASPLTQSIANSWQQQIHITGAGTGGSPCPSLTTNSNGFDVTLTNAPNMYTYDASKIQGQRWKVLTSTYTNLEAGKGFRINIRGDRSLGCSLLDGTPSGLIPSAVTLKTEGAIGNAYKNLGTFAINYFNVGIGNYVLVGNPYSSNISFAAIQGDNWSNINTNYAVYIPANAPGVYSYWSDDDGAFTGGVGYDDNTGNILANGQAFFVQSTVAGNISLNFNENMKITDENIGYFRTARVFNEKLKVNYLKDNQKVDEVVIRFANDAGVSNTTIGKMDIPSMNSGTYITSLKDNKGMVVQTRELQNLTTDEVWLNIGATASGNYQLNFSNYENFAGASIILKDHYTQTEQDVKQNATYSFSIDKDNAATKGSARFSIVFNRTIEPVYVTNIIKMYPNPANKQVTLKLPQSADNNTNYQIKITDLVGKVIMQEKVNSGTQNINIDKLTNGIYLVEIIDSKGNRTTEKLVKN
jgi:hypothetical protein